MIQLEGALSPMSRVMKEMTDPAAVTTKTCDTTLRSFIRGVISRSRMAGSLEAADEHYGLPIVSPGTNALMDRLGANTPTTSR